MQPGSRSPAKTSRIESWKEIAAFFGRDERTVKRWEKTRNLPIHRLPGEKGGVFAYTLELTAWLNSAADERPAHQEAVPDLGPDSSPVATGVGPESPALEMPAAVHLVGSAGDSSAVENPLADSRVVAGKPTLGGKPASLKVILIGCVSILAVLVLVYPVLRHFVHGTGRPAPIQAGDARVQKPAADPAAQEFYLKGRYYWNHRTDASLKLAVESFTQAVVRDPQYAPAYAGLADTYNLMTQYSFLPHAQAFPLALTAARKAVALDDSLSEAHRALAFGLFYWDWDVNAAFREYQRALALDPKDVEAHNWYATSLLVANRIPLAAAEVERAREIDPTSRIVIANQALILADLGQRQASIARLMELESAEPDFLAPPVYLGEIYFDDGNYPAYLIQAKRVAAISHDPDKAAIAEAAEHGWVQGGERGLLESLRKVYLKKLESGSSSGYELAHICARLGQKADADRYLQAAIDARDFQVMTVLYGDFNRIMKGDPGFEQMKNQIRLRMNRTPATGPGPASGSTSLPANASGPGGSD